MHRSSVAAGLTVWGARRAPTRTGGTNRFGCSGGGFEMGVRCPGAGLLCKPYDLSYKSFGKTLTTNCAWFVTVIDGKFVVANDGKPVSGTLVGDPALLAKYTDGADPTTATSRGPCELNTSPKDRRRRE